MSQCSAASCRKSVYAPRPKNARVRLTSVVWATHPSAERPNGLVTWRRQRRRIKIASTKVSQSRKVELTHLERASAAQPLRNSSKHPERRYGDVRRRRRRGRPKIGSVNVEIERVSAKIAQEDEMTHLGHARTAQPPQNAPKRRYGVTGPIRRRGRMKIVPRNINRTETDGNAHLRHTGIAQPRGNDPKRSYGVVGPWHRRGRIRSYL